MKILVPLPFDISCLQHGRNLRIVHVLRTLSERHEIICATAQPTIAATAQQVLPHVTIQVAPQVASKVVSQPFAATPSASLLSSCRSYLFRRAADFFGHDSVLHGWMRHLANDADVALGFDWGSAIYLSSLQATTNHKIATVCDLIDDPYLTHSQTNFGRRWSITGMKTSIALRLLRSRLLQEMDVLIAVAQMDAESILRTTDRPVRVIPNGVEIPAAAINSSPIDSPHHASNTFASREPLVVFTGSMNFPPNEQAACYLVNTIWPHIRQQVPNARLALVGVNPTPRVKALANHPGVTVTGRVADMGEWLRRARVAAAPILSGSGIKNKVLEACANGCAVVATPRAAAGIPSGPEHGILIAEKPALFAAQTARLLADEANAIELGRAGQSMVRQRFDWNRIAEAFEIVLRVCARRASIDQRIGISTHAEINVDTNIDIGTAPNDDAINDRSDDCQRSAILSNRRATHVLS